MYKIATWNVNSISVRLPDVITWLQQHDIDILALQETKTADTKFPTTAFTNLGYHVIIHGQKTYNGVATISKQPCTANQYNLPNFIDSQCRLIATTIDNLRIINIYIPNGATLNSEKFIYKMQWLEAASAYITSQIKIYNKLLILGDFNIAPTDLDVHNPDIWQNSILVSPQERAYFSQWLNLGLNDSFRLKYPQEKSFSWWDYRASAFRRNHGLRIDHILISDTLKNYCHDIIIDKNPRTAERPSDHAPVIILLEKEVLCPTT